MNNYENSVTYICLFSFLFKHLLILKVLHSYILLMKDSRFRLIKLSLIRTIKSFKYLCFTACHFYPRVVSVDVIFTTSCNFILSIVLLDSEDLLYQHFSAPLILCFSLILSLLIVHVKQPGGADKQACNSRI